MTKNQTIAQNLTICVQAFALISKKSTTAIIEEITQSVEDFDTIMFKHGDIELFFELNNGNRGTLIIN